MFVKIIDGVQVIAPTIFVTDDGYVINNFIKYLETMHELGLADKMYGFEYVDEVVEDKDNKIARLEEENMTLKIQQFEQDELIIENTFEIANIQLGGM